MLISRTSIQTSSDPERLHPTHNTRAIIPGTAPGHTSEYNGNTNPRVAPVVKMRIVRLLIRNMRSFDGRA
ncbi:unnamed protein product [Boreogadus saida]